VCAEINRRRVIRLAKRGKPTAMLTLTISSKDFPTPDSAAAELKRGLVALRKRINRRWPSEKMPFIAVFEKHKSGFPHLHLLIRARFMPIKWLREVWTDITGSWNVNIVSFRGRDQLASYAAKYIGKDLAAFEHCKRWWRSHDYDRPSKEEEKETRPRQEWRRWEADIRLLKSCITALGGDVSFPERDVIEWTGPPDKNLSITEVTGVMRSWYLHTNPRSIRPFGAFKS